ncbi:MAG: phage tail protein [Pseudomonadota bacterium]|nr:phage tail protein [Pseudomonadota bacterium]
MATEREGVPYSQFNFQVTIGDEGGERPQAGFQEVAGLGMEITVAEYRAGNSMENAPTKVTGTYKVPDITLKRGLMGYLDLYSWLDEVRNGAQDQLRTVKIDLMSEDRATVAMSWKLLKARPTKYTGPGLNGKGTDVAVEEIVLAAERIELS